MATISHESHRKHRLSLSDDNSPYNSKRLRHHSKHDEHGKPEIDMEEGEIVDDGELSYLDDHNINMGDDRRHGGLDESPKSVSMVNIDSKKRSPGRSKSPSKSSGKRRDKRGSDSKGQRLVELMEVDEREVGRNSYSLPTVDDEHFGSSGSPSHGRWREETVERSRSKSPDRMRERERSQSIVHERRSRSRHHRGRDEGIYENGKVCDHLDMEWNNGSIERTCDKRRERRSSRHRSSKLENGEFLDRKREEEDREVKREIDLDRKHEREKYHGRSKDSHYESKRRRNASISSYRDGNGERESDRKLDVEGARGSYRERDRLYGETDRSRRYYKYDGQGNGYGGPDRRHGYDEHEYTKERNRRSEAEKNWSSQEISVRKFEDANRDDDDQNGYEESVGLKLAEEEEVDDVESIKEKSRRLREAILQKHKAKQSQQQVAPQAESNEQLNEHPSQKSASENAVEEITYDTKNGEDTFVAAKLFDVEKSPLSNETVESNIGAVGLGKGSPKSERSNDMFCHDIFSDSPAGIRNTGKGDILPIERSHLNDNWDDPEGYYSFRLGEILDSRYEIMAAHGKGVFSTVVRAKDLKAGSFDPVEVAIKIIRNNETMLKAGNDELVILKKLVDADPDDKRHCVRYLSHFKYRNHLCIVFESLQMNLREVQKKFGRNIGLKLTAVRAYAKQLFIALQHLSNCGILHCDIKPDNMLVNDAKNVLKLCDFGNAMLAGKNEITPYLVSRFYRAPEIILGLPYDHPLDIWSVGCCLYELYTGRVLFPGATNNDMLRLHMELKGPFPRKMLRKGAFIEPHFDQGCNFLATEEDPVTKRAIKRLICNIKPKNIGTIIKGSPGEDSKMLSNFKDLLDKIFALDPDKRLSVSQALNHPFIAGK